VDIVLSEGLEALSIKRVADAADYTPGALYRYFPSKDALLASVVVRLVDALADELCAVEAADPLVRVVALCRAFRNFARRSPQAFGLLGRLLAESEVWIGTDQGAPEVGRAVGRALTPLAVALQEAGATGAIRVGDARQRALLLWVGLQGALQLRKQERIAPALVDADGLAYAMLTTLLTGFGADENSLATLGAEWNRGERRKEQER